MILIRTKSYESANFLNNFLDLKKVKIIGVNYFKNLEDIPYIVFLNKHNHLIRFHRYMFI